MEPSKGWICLYRSIKEHWLWEEKPFDKRSAWIDLLLSVNHKDKKVLIGNQLAVVKAGSFITSELKLAEAWGWSRTKVRNFLEMLELDSMIVKKSDNQKTVITVLNWYVFQEVVKEQNSEKEQHFDKVGSDFRDFKEQQKNNEKTSKEQQKNNEKTTKEQQENIKRISKKEQHFDKVGSDFRDFKEQQKNNKKTSKEQRKNNEKTTKEQRKNTNNNDNNDNNDNNGNNENNPPSFSQEYITDNPIEYFEQNITLVRNEIDKEQILDAVNEKGFVAFKRAVDISKKQGGRSLGYCLKVLYNSKNASKKKINDVTGSAEEVARLLREKGDYYKL